MLHYLFELARLSRLIYDFALMSCYDIQSWILRLRSDFPFKAQRKLAVPEARIPLAQCLHYLFYAKSNLHHSRLICFADITMLLICSWSSTWCPLCWKQELKTVMLSITHIILKRCQSAILYLTKFKRALILTIILVNITSLTHQLKLNQVMETRKINNYNTLSKKKQSVAIWEVSIIKMLNLDTPFLHCVDEHFYIIRIPLYQRC